VSASGNKESCHGTTALPAANPARSPAVASAAVIFGFWQKGEAEKQTAATTRLFDYGE